MEPEAKEPVVVHVRPINSLLGEPGTLIDVGEDGWIYWVGNDKFCHVSHPSAVRVGE